MASTSIRQQGLKSTALELFGSLASSYERALDATTLLQDRYWKQWVVENAGADANDLVLDIGCGTLLLEERLRMTGCRVVGLDLTEDMLRLGQEKRLPNVQLLVNGDAETLPVLDSTFDAVVSCYVPKYVDLEKFTSEVARVVKPEGKVVVYDFVRPRGIFLPFLALYIYGAVRIAGVLLGLARSQAAYTFKNLPRIVEGATWDARVVGLFGEKGVEKKSWARLSGGVVAAYSGVKTVRNR